MLNMSTNLPDKKVATRLTHELQELDEVARNTLITEPSKKLDLARRLALWAEPAWSVDIKDLRADRNTADASRYGSTAASLVAADNRNRSLSYLEAVTGRNVHGHRLAATTDLYTLSGLHEILHSGGLDTTGDGWRLRPGHWRTTESGVSDARTGRTHPSPDPKDLPQVMNDWSKAFHADAWGSVHPAVHAAQAYASLIAIRPFEDGNGGVARMVADKILRDRGYPATGLCAMSERYRAPINARLFDAIANDDVEGWTRAFIGVVTEGTDVVSRQLSTISEAVQTLVTHMGDVDVIDCERCYEIAASMMAYPIDRPITLAQRHGLDHAQTTALLRPLAHRDLVEMGRINGKQVTITHPGIEQARALAHPQASRLTEITRAYLRRTDQGK